MHTRVIRRSKVLASAAIIGSILAAACGSGGQAPATPAAAGAATAAASAAAIPTTAVPAVVSTAALKIGASPSNTWLPIRYAIDKGYVKEAGLPNATFVQIDSAQDAANALAANEIQFAGLAFERAALATIRGKQTQCVVSIGDTPPIAVVVSSKLDIKPGDWAALKGKTIGIAPGGWSEIVPKYFIQKAGLKVDDVKWTNTPSPATMLAGLKSGQIDGFGGVEPSQRQAIIEGSAKMFFDLETRENLDKFWPSPFQATCIQAQASYAKAEPAVVAAVVKATERALKEIKADPKRAIDYAIQSSPTVDRRIIEQSLQALTVTWSADGSISEKASDNVQKLLVDFGILPKAVPYKDVVYTGK